MKLLSLATFLGFAAVVVAADPARPDAAKKDGTPTLEGSWTVLCLEKDGQPVPDAKDMTVTLKDGALTCQCPKTKMTMKIEFTGPGKGKVTAGAAKEGEKAETKDAVFVMTNDYLAICVHDEQATTGSVTTYTPSSKSACSLVLKRSGSRDRKD